MGFDAFQVWRSWAWQGFLPFDVWEFLLLFLYVVVAAALVAYARRDFFRLFWSRLPAWGILLILPVFGVNLLVIEFSPPNLLPPPGIPVSPPEPFAALLGALPVFVAGAWLGGGPALTVGAVYGVLRVGMASGGAAEPLFYAFWAFLVGSLLRQDYRGRLPALVRQPLVAGPLATLLASPFLLLAIFAYAAGSGLLAGLDYAVTLTSAHLLPLLLESVVAAVLLTGVYLLLPRLRPVRATHRFPPYTRTLRRRLLFLFVPLIVLMTFALIYAVVETTLRVATLEAVEEMERDAVSAAGDVGYFIHSGQGLLEEFADDEVLRQGDPAEVQGRLEADLRTLAFFDQLSLFDLEGQAVALYPTGPEGDPDLTDEEQELLQRVIDAGAPQISTAHLSEREEVILSFLVPVEDEAADERFGVLVGRTSPGRNPMLVSILESLQWADSSGGGFVAEDLGDEWQVAAHPDASMLLADWELNEERPSIAPMERGRAYESLHAVKNTRELIYHLRVEGYPSWAVVMRLPYQVVLEQATKIAGPLLLLQTVLGSGLVVVVLLVTRWLTRPLQQLSAAADRIAEGDLEQVVEVPGNDEVARVGLAFEGMRVRLKSRLEDLSLLLRVSQSVSAALELPEGMPSILDGALQATQAEVARFVLLDDDGLPATAISRGQAGEGLDALDHAVTEVAGDLTGPLVVENVARAGSLAAPAAPGGVKSLVALPVRTKGRLSAVIWAGYDSARRFDASEIDLLSTLAGQAAVLVENTRLFQAAEGGRRRLAAILTSTTDAVLVTNRDDRVLLVNPAAEQAFDIVAGRVVGQEVSGSDLAPELVRLLEAPLPAQEALTEEVPVADGRTLYASVSAILNADGERIGRVAVMRDITRFKELDELKSDFVATVSHDLRAPLTFMRGYTTMLPMVGELSEKQREYVEKILQGVGQMSDLIDDLLDLGRIEAGVGLERRSCHLGAILVEAVDSMRARAAAKGLTLRLEPAREMAVVSGDAALLRQAMANLVDNAIKYTPSGGVVTVGLSVKDGQAVVRVADTGIGIAPEDQVRLFEKFYRVKRRDTANVPGTGLGLAIVKSVVDRHGGRVWVESELNKGSTFCVGLPLGDAGSAQQSAS